MAGSRKVYAPEFKLQAVQMVTDQKLSVAEAARRLGVTENLLHSWKKAVQKSGRRRLPGARATSPPSRRRIASPPGGCEASGDAERDILKKATAFFATQSKLTFAWVEERRERVRPVAVLCRVLGSVPLGVLRLAVPRATSAVTETRRRGR